MSVVRPKPPEDPIAVAGVALSPASAAAFDTARAAHLADPVVLQPSRMLAAYTTARATSELFALLAAARRTREAVDRFVVVASGAVHHAMRVVFATCCHPFHNELSRSERGGRPRLFFAGQDFDNDSLAGLLDLLAPAGRSLGEDLLDRSGAVVVDDGDAAGPVAAAAHLLRAAVRADGMTTVQGPPDLPTACGMFTAATILPAAVVGIDVVRLLEGAVAMNTRFAEAPASSNPVAFAAGFGETPPSGRAMECHETGRLDPLLAWQASLRASLLPERPSTPLLPAVISIGEPRRDPLVDATGVPWTMRSLRPKAMAAIGMPRLDEHAMGQLLQMLLIATVLERDIDRPNLP